MILPCGSFLTAGLAEVIISHTQRECREASFAFTQLSLEGHILPPPYVSSPGHHHPHCPLILFTWEAIQINKPCAQKSRGAEGAAESENPSRDGPKPCAGLLGRAGGRYSRAVVRGTARSRAWPGAAVQAWPSGLRLCLRLTWQGRGWHPVYPSVGM